VNRVKHFRSEAGLTIRELSHKSNVSIGYLSDLENNKVTNPTKFIMENIARALGVTVPEVFYPAE